MIKSRRAGNGRRDNTGAESLEISPEIPNGRPRDVENNGKTTRLAIYVDDARYEKRNRSANEPIYFFTHGSRAPVEFTVNQIGKDKITGYLSVPKATTTRSAQAGN